jgi:hypothetical protein
MPCIDYMLGSGHGRVYRTAVVYPPPAGRIGLFGTVPFPNWRGPGTDYKTVLDPLHQTASGRGDLHEQNSERIAYRVCAPPIRVIRQPM